LAQWTADPVQALLADHDTSYDLFITVGAFLLQLTSQAIVGAAALCAADRLAFDTRPSSSRPNPCFAGLKAQLDEETKMLDHNRDTLGALRANLEGLDGERKIYLDRAQAALAAELAMRRAEERVARTMRGAGDGARGHQHLVTPNN
jgi:hypothetical protein